MGSMRDPIVAALYDGAFDGARRVLGYAVIEGPMRADANAIFEPVLRRITISNTLSDKEKLLALVHEIAHVFVFVTSTPHCITDVPPLSEDIVCEICAYRALARMKVDVTSMSVPRLTAYLADYIIEASEDLDVDGDGGGAAQLGIQMLAALIAFADGAQAYGYTGGIEENEQFRMIPIITNYLHHFLQLFCPQ